MTWGFQVRGQGSKALEIDVYDVIGGGMFYGGVSAREVRRTLKDNPNAETIKLRINSPGGQVHEGFAIYADLVEHQARKEVLITGLAASMASVLMLVGDEVRIAATGFVMIHNPFALIVGGGSEKLRSFADYLEKVRSSMVDAYAARTKQPRADIEKWMDAETWMTASEAKDRGFVDEVVPANKGKAKAAAALDFDSRVYASASFADFENVPAELGAVFTQPPITPAPGGPAPEETPVIGEEQRPMAFAAISILVALGLTDKASEAETLAEIGKLKGRDGLAAKFEQRTGKTGEEALGTVEAWKQSHDQLPTVQKDLVEARGAGERTELDNVIEKGRTDKRLTKATADKYRARVEAHWKATAEGKQPEGDALSLAAAKACIEELPVQPHLAAHVDETRKPPAMPTLGSHDGKKYEDLTPGERADLRSQDGGEEIYAALRLDWVQRGKPKASKAA